VTDGWPTQLVLRIYYLFSTGRPDVSYISLYTLIASRMIQAFGAGTMVPVGMALIGDLYPEGKRARPLGVIAAVDTAGWVVGHLYGGIIVRYWNWKLIFWLNLPICLLGFILIWYLLRDVEQQESEGSMDWLGALLIGASLSLLNIALGTGEEVNLDQAADLPAYVLPALTAAVILFALFIWRQKTAEFPLIELDLFKRKNYFPASLANLFIGIGLFIAIANVPLFINSLVATSLDQGAWDSGWLLSGLTVPMALAAVPGGWLTERTNYRLPSVLGLILSIFGFGLMSRWMTATPYTTMIPHLMITGIGLGLTMAPIAAAVVNASPSKYRGTSSALVIIFRLVGMTIGVSGITTYDLRRSEVLVERLSDSSPGLSLSEISTFVLEQVIGETFLIAGLFALLALIPIFFLRKRLAQPTD
jgi:MFS family permease